MEDPSVERVDGPTPNGGTYYIAYYHDESGNTMTRMTATYVTIHEFSDQDELLQVHHAYLGDPSEPPT